MCAKIQIYKYGSGLNREVQWIKIQYDRKYKEILHTWTVKQRHRKKYIWNTIINLYFSLLGGLLSGGFCPRPKIYNLIYSYMISTI
jgi:hypothetical protein